MSELYRIEDEPRPGPLAQVAVNPIWPFFAIMFGGAWLSWPWFVLNAFALGSPTRWRELGLAAAGLAGTGGLAIGLLLLHGSGTFAESAIPYSRLGLTVWKLGVTYWLFTLQSRTFGLYEYYGGPVKNGMVFLLVMSFLVRPRMQEWIGPGLTQWILG